jgi:hypothetical protein
MATASEVTVDGVWDQIRQLPVEGRLLLASRILESLHGDRAGIERSATLGDLRGLMATDRAAPSDADVEQWLEEERSRKFE